MEQALLDDDQVLLSIAAFVGRFAPPGTEEAMATGLRLLMVLAFARGAVHGGAEVLAATRLDRAEGKRGRR
jgi:hypothetical protein